MQKLQTTFLAAFCWLLLSFCQLNTSAAQTPGFISSQSAAWADSIFNTLSYEEKIGQLFMVDAYSNRDSAHVRFIDSLVTQYHIGGIIFFRVVR